MSPVLQYGMTAKILHWMIVGLLAVQYPLGWLMPDIHRGMQPGVGMTLHISIGLLILVVIAARLIWRITHPVIPESSLPQWQRLASELLHWMLYIMILLTAVSGWLFASFRGWSASLFYLLPFPMLTSEDAQAVKTIDGLHQAAEWLLLGLVSVHVIAALIHLFYYRDRVMARMLIANKH